LALRRKRDGAEAAKPVFLPGGIVAFATITDTESVPAFRLTGARIEQLAQACASRGIPFVLAGAPQKELVDPETQRFITEKLVGRSAAVDFDAMRRWLDSVAERFGAWRFDPVPDFRTGLVQDKDYWFHKDNHLNPVGHRRLGEDLAAWLEPRLR
jgi:lysophospholipase L1-like esterase